jgi:hypothetical protein
MALYTVLSVACLLSNLGISQLIVAPTVISNSSAFGPRIAQHIVDGSGLTVGLSGILGAADTTHGNNTDASMWYSDPFLTPADTTPYVVLDLGAEYDLQTTRIWQYNQAPYDFTVFGAAEVEISVSSDNVTYESLGSVFPTRAGGTNGEPAQDFSTPTNGVRYVKLQIWTSFGGAQATGLSEVRFVVDSSTAPPVIVGQPQNQTLAPGETASFTVTVEGPAPFTYQWRMAGTNLTDGGNISGTTTSNLLVSSVNLASEGQYDVIVGNANGSITSTKATLFIGSPIITQQPQNVTKAVGMTADFTVDATDFGGNPSAVTYQWRKNGIDLVDGGDISGVTTTNLTIVNLEIGDNGVYTVRVTDTIGKTTLSANRNLTVAPYPTVGLDFITEPILAPTVISNSSAFGPRIAQHIVDGSGLTVGLSGILGAADTTHGNNTDASMWYSDPFLTPADTTPYVVLDLGAEYDLQTTRIWQYNQAPYDFTVFGAAEVEISVSSDNVTYESLGSVFPTRAGGTNGEPAQDFSTPTNGVRYVKLQIWTSFGGAQATGLSEVRFVAAGSRANVILNGGVLGLHYRIEHNASLNPETWQVLQDIPSLNNSPLSVTDGNPVSTQAARYYRAVLVLP